MAPMKGGYWQEGAGFPLERVDPTLFTHMYCAFAKVDPSTHRVLIPNTFSQFSTVLKGRNPSMKTLLSIGGAAQDATDSFDSMVADQASRRAFINSAIQVARDNWFDGIDLDYEMPSNEALMSNLAELLTEWRAAVEVEVRGKCKAPLLLTAAVNYTSANYDGHPYPADAIRKNLNWINVMSYDLWIPNWPANGARPAAVLYDPDNINGRSGSGGIDAWIQAGIPTEMIVLGIPFYGRAWKLENANNHGYGARATGSATGPGISDGAVTYSNIQAFLKSNPDANAIYDPDMVGNYCYSGTTWISYDDKEAIARKVAFVKEKNLLGYFAWRVGGDGNTFPLATTASQSL